MSKALRYQLVIQFPENFFKTIEEVQAFENRLTACMPKTCEVDGCDVGSGTVNFFVYTSAPLAAYKTFRKYLGTRAVEKNLRIAYREDDGDLFTNLWPRRDPRPFKYMYQELENPFARRAKKPMS